MLDTIDAILVLGQGDQVLRICGGCFSQPLLVRTSCVLEGSLEDAASKGRPRNLRSILLETADEQVALLPRAKLHQPLHHEAAPSVARQFGCITPNHGRDAADLRRRAHLEQLLQNPAPISVLRNRLDRILRSQDLVDNELEGGGPQSGDALLKHVIRIRTECRLEHVPVEFFCQCVQLDLRGSLLQRHLHDPASHGVLGELPNSPGDWVLGELQSLPSDRGLLLRCGTAHGIRLGRHGGGHCGQELWLLLQAVRQIRVPRHGRVTHVRQTCRQAPQWLLHDNGKTGCGASL
mmetsp:Transcript_63235/g.159480  ORF Transcript_63235/g.159480 Transcript_63235/m.159480 type:complete len:292 (+) Transcript_63235:200-1075(+)